MVDIKKLNPNVPPVPLLQSKGKRARCHSGLEPGDDSGKTIKRWSDFVDKLRHSQTNITITLTQKDNR